MRRFVTTLKRGGCAKFGTLIYHSQTMASLCLLSGYFESVFANFGNQDIPSRVLGLTTERLIARSVDAIVILARTALALVIRCVNLGIIARCVNVVVILPRTELALVIRYIKVGISIGRGAFVVLYIVYISSQQKP
jgi:hypothetical protein